MLTPFGGSSAVTSRAAVMTCLSSVPGLPLKDGGECSRPDFLRVNVFVDLEIRR